MKQLPSPKIYEKENKYMPWGKTIDAVLKIVTDDVPQRGKVIDLMCGPGYLLGKISKQRKDLELEGLDNDSRYIDYASKKYPEMIFSLDDVLNWKPEKKYNAILLTGGLHHIEFENQEKLLKLIHNALTRNGILILADPFIDSYKDEKERKIAATKLGYEYLKAILENDAPDDIVKATIDLIYNDVLLKGEYKTSINRLKDISKKIFLNIKEQKIWPNNRIRIRRLCFRPKRITKL